MEIVYVIFAGILCLLLGLALGKLDEKERSQTYNTELHQEIGRLKGELKAQRLDEGLRKIFP